MSDLYADGQTFSIDRPLSEVVFWKWIPM